MQPPDKYHQARLKGIAKTLATAESNRKKLVAMASKMAKNLALLNENIASLNAKIERYKTLQANVEKDPNFKMNPSDLNP